MRDLKMIKATKKRKCKDDSETRNLKEKKRRSENDASADTRNEKEKPKHETSKIENVKKLKGKLENLPVRKEHLQSGTDERKEMKELKERKQQKRRKKKEEKKRLKETENNGQEVVGDPDNAGSASASALRAMEYLRAWKTDRSKWKFSKLRQCWLLKNMYDESKVEGEDFEILLSYLEGLKGKSREQTVQEAEKLADTASEEAPSVKSERLRKVLQLLT